MYYGDESSPSLGNAGGAYFKFIPATPWAGGNITRLDESPLAAGRVFGLRLGKRATNNFGQGSNTAQGVWVPVPNAATPGVQLRSEAARLKLTGFYRPRTRTSTSPRSRWAT